MALKSVGPGREVCWFPTEGGMAKWFKDIPMALKNGAHKTRSVSESGSQQRANKAGLVISIGTKAGHRKNSSAGDTAGAGGVGSLLPGMNRKNSGAEVSRNGVSSQKDGNVWDTLMSGKTRKNSKTEAVLEEQHRFPKASSPACAYISRMIRVEKQDKSPNFSTVSSPVRPEAEEPDAQCKTETVSFILRAHCFTLSQNKRSKRNPTEM